MITRNEVIKALKLANKAIVDMPNFPSVVTPETVVNLAGHILIANAICFPECRVNLDNPDPFIEKAKADITKKIPIKHLIKPE